MVCRRFAGVYVDQLRSRHPVQRFCAGFDPDTRYRSPLRIQNRRLPGVRHYGQPAPCPTEWGTGPLCFQWRCLYASPNSAESAESPVPIIRRFHGPAGNPPYILGHPAEPGGAGDRAGSSKMLAGIPCISEKIRFHWKYRRRRRQKNVENRGGSPARPEGSASAGAALGRECPPSGLRPRLRPAAPGNSGEGL